MQKFSIISSANSLRKFANFVLFIHFSIQSTFAFYSTTPTSQYITNHIELYAADTLSINNVEEVSLSQYTPIQDYTEVDKCVEGMDALPIKSEEILDCSESRNQMIYADKEMHQKQHKTIPTDLPKLSDILSTLNTSSEESSKPTSNEHFNNTPTVEKLPINIRNEIIQESDSITDKIPWRANYDVSRKTQDKIRAAASFHKDKSSRMTRSKKVLSSTTENLISSIRVLSALIDETPSYECNEVNVLYAFTLTAKIYPVLSQNMDELSQEEFDLRKQFHSKLVCTLQVVSQLVQDERLSGRQLSNAAWAIIRHCMSNSALLNASFMQGSDDESFSSKSMEELLDAIALQLIKLSSTCSPESISNTTSLKDKEVLPLKPAELCMAAWAYAMLKPRNCPTGWNLPPQETRIPRHVFGNVRALRKNEIVFEEAVGFSSLSDHSDNNKVGGEEKNKDYVPSTIDLLFDSIADSFLPKNETHVDSGKKSLQSQTSLRHCTWKELSNLAWSFASHGAARNPSQQTQQFLLALAQEIVDRFSMLQNAQIGQNTIKPPKPRDISIIAWSLGVIQVDDYHLSQSFSEVIDAITHQLLPMHSEGTNAKLARPFKNWKGADIVQLAIALAHGRIDKKILLNALFTEALSQVESQDENQTNTAFHTRELSVLLWVQAKLNLSSSQGDVYATFSKAVTRCLVKNLRSAHHNDKDISGSELDISLINAGPQEQANLAWSLTVLESYDPDSILLLQSIFATASSEQAGEESFIKLEHAHQLWQALFILRVDCPEAVAYVRPSFGNFLCQKWEDEKLREKNSSHRHRALSQTLELMRVSHVNEHDEDIDIAIVLKGPKTQWTHNSERNIQKGNGSELTNRNPKVAVEFDGPTHFTRLENVGQPRALGHTVMKYRMLKIKGWTVVRVPYYEFDKIPFWASMERQRYLQRALKTHANIKFSDLDVSEYKPQVHNRKSRFD